MSASELETRLGRAFAIVPGLEAVNVRERAGVVVLEGRVTSPKASAAAEQIANETPGVVWVSNTLELAEQAAQNQRSQRSEQDQTTEERLRSVFAEVDDLRRVQVSVRAGVVELTGTAASKDALERAEQIAAKQDGVVYVDNNLAETDAVEERVSPALERLERLRRTTVARLPLFAVALAIVVTLSLMARSVARSERLLSRLVRNRMLRGIVQQLLASLLVVIGVLLALDLVEATSLVGAVLGAAGLAGIALGLAFREIGENYLASLLLGLRRPFAQGDHVMIGEHEGKVVRLTTRETVLMSLDGNHVRLPNSQVFKSVIVNYSSNPLRRLSFEAGIGTNEHLAEAQRVGVATLSDTPGVVGDPAPFARVEELGDSSVSVRFFAWVDQRTADWYKVRSEAVRRVKHALDAAGIALPVPAYRIETIEPRSKSQPPPPAEMHEECEVGVDDVLEQQIETERRKTGEEDLLEPNA